MFLLHLPFWSPKQAEMQQRADCEVYAQQNCSHRREQLYKWIWLMGTTSLSDFKSCFVKTRLCAKLSTSTQNLAGNSTLVSHNTISARLAACCRWLGHAFTCNRTRSSDWSHLALSFIKWEWDFETCRLLFSNEVICYPWHNPLLQVIANFLKRNTAEISKFCIFIGKKGILLRKLAKVE